MRLKYWYDRYEDQIVAVQELKRSIHMHLEDRLYEWMTANGKIRLFDEIDEEEILKDSPEELFKARSEWLDQQINKLEKRKILKPEIVEF